MRFSLLAALALFALPAQAQTSFSPLLGYDLELEGPSIGLAVEVGAPLEGVPLKPSVRPLIEYVFVDSPDGLTYNFIRANADLIGRFESSPGASFLPYAKAGVGVEYFGVSGDDELGGLDIGGSNTELALNIGGGAEFSRFFVEGELGLSGYDGVRIRAGYRF